jgi:RNA polymerase sigma-70 factor, ECF subfamily
MNYAKLDCPYSELDEFHLVQACQQKSVAAFNELYRRYLHHVRAVLHRLGPDLSQIHEDIVQEVFLRIWRSLDTLRNVRAFRSWLNRLVTNLFYNELRKHPRQFVLSTDDCLKGSEGVDDADCVEIADNRARPDEVCERRETIVFINKAIKRLPERQKKIFVLREYYGLPYEEIASCTNTELGTVKSRLSRAKCKMQYLLKPLVCA